MLPLCHLDGFISACPGTPLPALGLGLWSLQSSPVQSSVLVALSSLLITCTWRGSSVLKGAGLPGPAPCSQVPSALAALGTSVWGYKGPLLGLPLQVSAYIVFCSSTKEVGSARRYWVEVQGRGPGNLPNAKDLV